MERNKIKTLMNIYFYEGSEIVNIQMRDGTTFVIDKDIRVEFHKDTVTICGNGYKLNIEYTEIYDVDNKNN